MAAGVGGSGWGLASEERQEETRCSFRAFIVEDAIGCGRQYSVRII